MHKLFSAMAALTVAGVFAGCTTASVDKAFHPSPKPAAQTPQRFEKTITRAVGLDYLLFLPEGYREDGTNGWPLMLFLHGAGERGRDLQKVTVHGPPKIVQTRKDFPFVLVSPQCPTNQVWRDEELLALLDEVIAKHNIDTNRIYLTGLSMGGYGTWSLGTKYPERFAAIAPICGGGERLHVLLSSREKRAQLNSLGVWAFHGAKDTLVPLEESQRMTNALIRAGGKDVKLTVYPEAAHDSWTPAYNEPEIWNWFLAHRREK